MNTRAGKERHLSRQRRKREARRARARQLHTSSTEPGKASKYIRHLKRYREKHPDLAVVLYFRVSSGPQEHKGNLATYESKLRRVCEKRDIPIVDVFPETCSGKILNGSRTGLVGAIECAKQHEAETGVHTAVLAPCTDRFIRNEFYNSKTNPEATPTDAEFRRLRELTDGVRLLTYLHPDMSLKESKRRQTKWGQQFKGRKGGGDRKPGWRKRRKAKLQSQARCLYEKLRSYREVAQRLGVALRTAWKWVNEQT